MRPPDPARPRGARPRPRHLLLAALVLGDVLVFLVLMGAWSTTAQAERVVDPDTVDACAVALAAEQGGSPFDYELEHPRFAGTAVLEADFRRRTSADARDAVQEPGPPAGTVRCRVEPGEEIDDAMSVVEVEVEVDVEEVS